MLLKTKDAPRRRTPPRVERLSRPHKIRALMNYYGITRAEAIVMLEDMGEQKRNSAPYALSAIATNDGIDESYYLLSSRRGVYSILSINCPTSYPLAIVRAIELVCPSAIVLYAAQSPTTLFQPCYV